MIQRKLSEQYADLASTLKIDCKKCSGLCCVALYCMKTDGFPENKEAGKPCKNLAGDFRCSIHSKLARKNMKGCFAYDCFGAGQKVTQVCYPNGNWRTHPQQASEIFDVFLVVFQLHQMLWYLLDALSFAQDGSLQSEIETLIFQNEQMTRQSPQEILNVGLETYRAKVNRILGQVTEAMMGDSVARKPDKDCFGRNFKKANLDGRDFSMSLMIAANLEGCSLRKTNFLSADMRDANIKNTDLSESVFLTQMQINSAKGNSKTKLPVHLSPPSSW